MQDDLLENLMKLIIEIIMKTDWIAFHTIFNFELPDDI